MPSQAIENMLEQAGFRDIAITGDYPEEPLSVAHKSVMVCRAVRSAASG